MKQFDGTLTTWKGDKGFGFITPFGGGREIFVHISEFPTTKRPAVGDKLIFQVKTNPEGKKKAVSIKYFIPVKTKVPIQTKNMSRRKSNSYFTKIAILACVFLGIYTYQNISSNKLTSEINYSTTNSINDISYQDGSDTNVTELSNSSSDALLSRAYSNQESGVQVSGQGVVVRLLPDDNDGSRHQKFIIELTTGQTLLVAHNIDIAPRVSSIREGDLIEFNGEYEWNEKGGVIHWTHRDPNGSHVSGWLKNQGQTFQ